MALLLQPDSLFTKTVKNLGWLLDHWEDVGRAAQWNNQTYEFIGEPSFFVRATGSEHQMRDHRMHDAYLIVRLKVIDRWGGRVLWFYITTFADRSLLWQFLHRPVFYGLLVDWYGTIKVIKKGEKHSVIPGIPTPEEEEADLQRVRDEIDRFIGRKKDA